MGRPHELRSVGRGKPVAVPTARLDIKVPDRLGAVEFLEIDHNGRMFLFAENIPVSGGTAGAFVARYSPAGGLQGIYELPLSNVPLSRRFVTVSGDGDVYFLRTQSSGVDVLGLGFRTVSGKVIDIRLWISTVSAFGAWTGRGSSTANPTAGHRNGVCIRRHPMDRQCGCLRPRP